jgi:hypothetical protein
MLCICVRIISCINVEYIYFSPDIVTLFTMDVPHAQAFYYEAEVEDFAASNLSQLDTWVFDRVDGMLFDVFFMYNLILP